MVTQKTIDSINFLIDLEELKTEDRNIVMIKRLIDIKQDVVNQVIKNNHKIY